MRVNVNLPTLVIASSLMVAVGLAPGCARRSTMGGTRVTGTVTIGGKPASGATVRFFDDEGKSVGAGTAGDDGAYAAVDVPQKPLKVAVEEGASTGPYGFKPPDPGTAVLPGTPLVPPAKIPKKYQKPDTSGLTVTVSGKEQKQDFSLE